MVVKNVAGLDMGKLMIGSFGTLAAIAVVNFKLQPMPEVERSFLLPFDSLAAAIAARDRILKSVLQPAAIDLLNPAARRSSGTTGYLLAVQAGGNAAAVERYEREFAQLTDGLAFEDERQRRFWRHVEDFTPRFLATHEDGAVVRVSCTLKDSEAVMASFDAVRRRARGLGRLLRLFRRRAKPRRDWMAQRPARLEGCDRIRAGSAEAQARSVARSRRRF